jgi:hypothetical protein
MPRQALWMVTQLSFNGKVIIPRTHPMIVPTTAPIAFAFAFAFCLLEETSLCQVPSSFSQI